MLKFICRDVVHRVSTIACTAPIHLYGFTGRWIPNFSYFCRSKICADGAGFHHFHPTLS